MKKLIIILLLAIPAVLVSAQDAPVKWYSIEEAVAMAQKSPRPMFVDAYTDWCGWCKKLDKDTFSNPVIAEILNTKYYAVKFDAEGKEPVTFQGRKFVNDGSLGKTHQLAYALLQGKLGYPSLVFLTASSELITPISGYKTPAQLEPLLSYFAGTSWQKQSYEDFLKTFKGKAQ
ncbi:MAG: thioredoxin family protein [Bacteroidales bacterium]